KPSRHTTQERLVILFEDLTNAAGPEIDVGEGHGGKAKVKSKQSNVRTQGTNWTATLDAILLSLFTFSFFTFDLLFQYLGSVAHLVQFVYDGFDAASANQEHAVAESAGDVLG